MQVYVQLRDITRKRIQSFGVKSISMMLYKITGKPIHRKVSKILRQHGKLKDSPLKYSIEENASLIPVYEKHKGEWERIISSKIRDVPMVHRQLGMLRVVEAYLNGELSRKEAKAELSKQPVLWKKAIRDMIKSGEFTDEEVKKLRRLLFGPY